ncbi:hypothetical protein FAES_3809 [Fibrella aestuarina BUZ 2]|uniref:DUF4494 domain-containing protein n=1 Tax=Fibrella aestuarina BUZ 2 TaxID=1166018 RepID=I0KCG3_9BACT|nr:DUF4494 domain-containing protein [Fibrella aestuarina]CCH01816.1 hypothetical protein FAES_3809 [Fibrella aestuarina BUZ 2]
MPTWFIGKIRYQQTDDSVAVDTQKDGSPEAPKLKTINETYLLDAVSYTDAEARLYRVVADNTPEFEITAIRPMRLSDVFHIEGGDNWYKCKTYYMTEDDKGRQKKVVSNMLINGANLREAHQRLADNLSTMLVPVEITDINLTPILEVVPYDALEPEIPANLKPLAQVQAEAEVNT